VIRGLHREIICAQRRIQQAAGRGSDDLVPAGEQCDVADEEEQERTKKNKKSNRRGATAARSAQPRARHDGAQAATAGAPPGLLSARSAPPGLVRATGEYSKLVPAMDALPVLVPAPGTTAAQAPRGRAGSGGPVASATGQASANAAPEAAAAETSDSLPAWAAKAIEELLTVTYWLDPGQEGEPFTATIRFAGRRAGVSGDPEPGDTFWQEETVERIVPGSGPVAITAEVRGIPSGPWTVTARPVTKGVRPYPPDGHAAAARRVPWPRRLVIPAGPGATVTTSSLLRSKVPGIIRFAYASLVSLGVLAGLGLEVLLLDRGHYPAFRPLVFSAIAIVAGVIGGKAWYVTVHRGRKFDGWCIQGFVAGAAVVVAAAAFADPGVPRGAYLSVAAPALLIGMAIGRTGCFWAGCCTGRPTASRWGIWSSDRRVGCRREPAQLLEALAALIIGVAVLAVGLLTRLRQDGPVAVAGLAAYTLSRQFIIGLRAEPRQWRYGRPVTAAIAAIGLIASAVLLARG
jgi:phosphatidylglycerol---prolipoprotein diacylglyceryl transferase